MIPMTHLIEKFEILTEPVSHDCVCEWLKSFWSNHHSGAKYRVLVLFLWLVATLADASVFLVSSQAIARQLSS